MLKLAELEDGRLKQDIDRVDRQLNELKDRENGYEVQPLLTYLLACPLTLFLFICLTICGVILKLFSVC